VINIQYLKEFHPIPERFAERPTDAINDSLDIDDTVDSTERERRFATIKKRDSASSSTCVNTKTRPIVMMFGTGRRSQLLRVRPTRNDTILE
jgi:hypothetical protein